MDRILVAEKIAEEGLQVLRQAAEVDVRLNLDPAELARVIVDYDALVVRSATKVTAPILQAGKKLRVVGRAGTGVDTIDVEEATRLGIMVVNAPTSNSVAVAELAIGLLLSLARRIPPAYQSLSSGKWEKSAFMGWEVRGKTLGIVGLGRIGSEVARRARGMEMDVLAYDPVVSPDRAEQLGVTLLSLDELLSRSDVITVHVPLVEQTRNLFDPARFAHVKKGAYFINASRGEVVDEDALLAALENGTLAGAALDVFHKEPPGADHPLVNHPRVICTPHLGASTTEAQTLSGTDVAEGVVAALQGGTPRYSVNAPFVAPEEWRVLEPYMRLGRRMAGLCRQLVQSPVRSFELEANGELADVDTQAIRVAVLMGLLEGTSEANVTPVNAPLIARERGLRLSDRSSADAEDYAGLLILRAVTAEGTHEFRGTVLRNQPEIVQADGYWVNFEPTGALMFTYHRDRPGLIGRVGTLLGEANVNISAMHVGRLAPREHAMMVLRLDEAAPAEVLARVTAEPDIDRAIGVVL